ncbi:hypothetical protein PG994_000368 [Apiospora phragmitis]|uniref:Uncharacterized protein n=1 Tax=Apiospora phragmitis TaxID=2905665 RepID=A0ABR1X610_9PEZI
MSQLPADAVGTAVGVLFYSLVCEICNIVMVWLLLVHEEGLSCEFLLPESIIQQFHDYIFWEDVITAQFNNKTEHVGNPQLTIANGSVGLDLVLFYIRSKHMRSEFYCYTVEATFVLFWAFSLTQSVYGWSDKPRWRRIFKQVNAAGKIISVALPLLTVCLLQVPVVQSSFVGFIVLADIEYLVPRVRQEVIVDRNYLGRTSGQWEWTQTSKPRHIQQMVVDLIHHSLRVSCVSLPSPWLDEETSFSLLFFADQVLSPSTRIFEVVNIIFQIAAQQNNNRDAAAAVPDMSAGRAISVTYFNMPGVTASLLAFVVFGTTRPFRERMYQTFVPGWFQKKKETTRRASQHLQYNRRDSASKQRSTSIKLSKGVDTVVRMEDLRGPRRGTYLDKDIDSDSERKFPRDGVTTTIEAGSRV